MIRLPFYFTLAILIMTISYLIDVKIRKEKPNFLKYLEILRPIEAVSRAAFLILTLYTIGQIIIINNIDITKDGLDYIIIIIGIIMIFSFALEPIMRTIYEIKEEKELEEILKGVKKE